MLLNTWYELLIVFAHKNGITNGMIYLLLYHTILYLYYYITRLLYYIIL